MILGLLKMLDLLTILMGISHELASHDGGLTLLVHLPLWGVVQEHWHG